MKRYRVWLRSKPGFYTQYDGKVDVIATDKLDAERMALRTLRRGAFKDRSDSMWTIERIECMGGIR